MLSKKVITRYLRFVPSTYQGWTCLRVEVFGCKDCNDDMGLERYELPDKSLSASSIYYAGHEPWLGRLWDQRGEGAWCALENDGNQYLQLDFGHPVHVRGVATQGKYRKSWWAIKEYAWVKTYKLSYAEYFDDWSYSGYIGRWMFYTEDGSTHKVFSGNTGFDTVRHMLSKKVITRYLRFVPSTYQGWTCLRVEVFGCKVCDEPLGMEEFHITREQLLESTGRNLISSPNRPDLGRLNYKHMSGWGTKTNNEKKWLQVDLDSELAYVTAVATQGDRKYAYNGIAKYILSFSLNQLDWSDYQEEWETKLSIILVLHGYYSGSTRVLLGVFSGITRIFEAERPAFQVTKIYLKHKTRTRYIRFWTEEQIREMVMSVEVFGCRALIRLIYKPLHSGLSSLLSGSSGTNSETYPKYYTGSQTRLIRWYGEPAINRATANATWCAESGEFLRVDFGSVKHVRAIYMQGHPAEAKWVAKIKFSHSADGLFFKTFKGYNNIEEFMANVDTHKIVRLSMDPYLFTRILHIHPTEFEGAPCMRIALYGDEACSEPLGVESGLIPNKAMRGTSWITIDRNRKNARLNNIEGEGAWCPAVVDQTQFFEINLGQMIRVTGVATQGRLVYLGVDTWRNYTEKGVTKVSISRGGHMEELHRERCYKVENEPMVNSTTPVTSSAAKPGYESSKAELLFGSNNAWCANDGNDPFIEVDLGRSKVINEVAICGLPDGNLAGNTYEATKHELVFPITSRHVRLYPITWNTSSGSPCLTLQLYGKEECMDALGMQEWRIPRSAVSASSRISTNYMPWMARLDSTEFGGAWCARRNAVGEYLQIDLGLMARVTAIVLQGKEAATKLPSLPEAWVEKYVLWYSDDGLMWEEYKEDGTTKEFQGNNDGKAKSTSQMNSKLFTRFLRIYPKSWRNHICMRADIIGCEYCGNSLGLESQHIPDSAIRASSSTDGPRFVRLNLYDRHQTFQTHLPGEFMDIDLGPAMKRVSGFAIQGGILAFGFVTKVAVAYSKDGIKYLPYLDEDGTKEKVFNGAWGRYLAFKRRIYPHVFARYIRIIVKSVFRSASIHVEIYGCDCTDAISIVTLKASSEQSGKAASNAGLKSMSAAWCARIDDVHPYLEADLRTVYVITSILTFGDPVSKVYVASYNLTSSLDNVFWQEYVERDLEGIGNALIKFIKRGSHEGHMAHLQFPFKARYIRIGLVTSSGRCMKVQFYGRHECKEDLGMQTSMISDSSVTASSIRNLGYKPNFARIGRHYGNGAWCAATDAKGEYLQVDLGVLYRVTGVALQAKLKDTQGFVEAWVKLFKIVHSSDGITWNEHKENRESTAKEFPGPSSKYDTSKVNFTPAVYTRFIRIVALSWETHVCMRIELYGCRACGDALGLEDFRVPDGAFTSSGVASPYHLPHYGRLGHQYGYVPINKNFEDYLQVDLGKEKVITGVATSPYRDRLFELTEYALEYSQDGRAWTMHKNTTGDVILKGHRHRMETVRNDLDQNITARYVRLRPKAWLYDLNIMMELYGCDV
ncbi:predicted protein [Nematostella vectensis]|uniref:F5/8 type C domain-containing protein n=1 Tax=Nematostella vectensis TaxID=45351 RepID=A7S2T0_NEMVE|nr:predicted protein [Nematostella vectensis]|eukprot:XP_001634043.1 predicted protein [Nematostella vectensis]